MKHANIYDNLPTQNNANDNEEFLKIIQKPNVTIERIVSTGQITPENFWYNQKQNEFVIVLKGEAIIEFKDKEIILKEGDYLNIKAHKKHRVKYTSKDEPTIWLAVFY